MNVIIVGCGRVGETLASQLLEEGNHITVVDVNQVSVSEISSKYDVMGVTGNGATHTVLEEAGINSADLLIAVTGSDELNLLCCLIAKRSGHCQTIARVNNPIYSAEASYLKNELGLAMVINPEHATAQEIARVIRFPSAMKIDTFSGGKVELVKFRLPESSTLVGMAVKEVVTKLKCDILICTVERGDEAYIAKGDFVFEGKDVISIIASPKNAQDFFKKINYTTRSVKDVIVVGGKNASYYLCDMLDKAGIYVKIVEENEARCRELAGKWKNVAVILADASDKAVLLEEGIQNAGAFVAMTPQDEENVLLSLYAKSVGNAKLITKINRVDYDDVIKHLNLDSIVYPENITSDIIVRYARAMKNTMGSNVETMYNVIKGKVEASEFTVKENSPITGTPLSQLKFKKDVLIAAIMRDKKVMIPRGYDVICPGDKVIIVSGIMALHDICDVLR